MKQLTYLVTIAALFFRSALAEDGPALAQPKNNVERKQMVQKILYTVQTNERADVLGIKYGGDNPSAKIKYIVTLESIGDPNAFLQTFLQESDIKNSYDAFISFDTLNKLIEQKKPGFLSDETRVQMAMEMALALNSENKEIRSYAQSQFGYGCFGLVDSLLASLPKTFVQLIRQAAKAHPNEGDDRGHILLLLARFGDASDIPLILSARKEPYYADPRIVELACAKLGDKVLRQKFLDEYNNAPSLGVKVRKAFALGFIGDRECLLALSSEGRNGTLVPESNQGEQVRAHVLGAIAYGGRVPGVRQWDWVIEEADMIKVEEWCEKELGVRWSQQRPPFTPHITNI